MIFDRQRFIYRAIVKEIGKRDFRRKTLEGLAVAIAMMLPEKWWYKAAYQLSFFTGLFIRPELKKLRSIGLNRAEGLNSLLSLLTRTGKPYPIKVVTTGMEHLDSNDGLVLCTAHIPLVKVSMASILQSGFTITAAITNKPTPDGTMAVWGINNRIPTIARSPTVLIRARTILNCKGSVLLMLDKFYGDAYSPNMLRLCGKTGGRALFYFAELKMDGKIYVSLEQPPYPYCKTEAEIVENLKSLAAKIELITERYKQQPKFFNW